MPEKKSYTPPRGFLTVEEVATRLGISASGVHKLIQRDKLKAIKRSERKTLVPEPALKAYLAKINGRGVSLLVPRGAERWQEDFEDILSRFREPYLSVIQCRSGWFEIIVNLHRDLKKIAPNYEIKEIKEKYGKLSYYIDYSSDYETIPNAYIKKRPPSHKTDQGRQDWFRGMRDFASSPEGQEIVSRSDAAASKIEDLLRRAEEESARTCEGCSEAGKTKTYFGMYIALCGKRECLQGAFG